MERSVQCQCGHVRGRLSQTERCTRVLCYCRDCQAFAVWLGKSGDMLDPLGGTDVVISHPQQLELTAGLDALQCMSLSDKGMLRWYAACCNSPIGNTARDRKLAFAGLCHSFVAPTGAELLAACGPVRMVSFPKEARGPVAPSGWRAVVPMLGFVRQMLGARLSGSYRRSPFFSEQGQPLATPTVLTPAQRAALN